MFQILGSAVLEEYYSKHSASLYQFLKPLVKETYADNERIVFYNYAPLDSELLDHLTKTLEYLNIPEFFVEVISNQKSTQDYLLNRINVQLIDHIESTRPAKVIPIFNDKNMCAHAWAGIHLWPDGTAGPCCESLYKIPKPNGELYNIKNDSINDIINSPWMNQLRDDFRNGVKPKNCEFCWVREDLGQDSRRTLATYRLKNIYGDINWEQEGQLMYLGGHLGSLCNLKCRICDSRFSSSIANEKLLELPIESRKGSLYYERLKTSEWVFETAFWDELKQHSSVIKSYELLGGEPFLLKETLSYMQYLIDNNLSQDTVFYFSSNGTQYPKVLELADQFKTIEITLSIDNVGDRYELERCNAKWDEVEQNVQRMVNLRERVKNLKIFLCVTVNIQNVLYLPELLAWSRTIKFDSFYLNYVHRPQYLSITAMTPSAKDLVIKQLESADLTDSERIEVDAVISAIKSSDGSDGKEFCKVMKRFDLSRNQNFAVTHADIAKTMGYV